MGIGQINVWNILRSFGSPQVGRAFRTIEITCLLHYPQKSSKGSNFLFQAWVVRSAPSANWPTIGQRLVNDWSTIGQQLVNNWSTIGQQLVNNCTTIGQQMVNKWSTNGQQLVNHWSTIGQQLVKNWSTAANWDDTRPICSTSCRRRWLICTGIGLSKDLQPRF